MSQKTDELLKLATDPDKVAEALLGLADEIKAIESLTVNATNQKDDLEKKVAELRDTNQKLFLRITGEIVDEKAEPTNEEIFNQLFTQQVLGKREGGDK